MKSMRIVLVMLACLLLAFGTGCEKLRARDNLNKGVAAYKSAKYPEAVEFFKQSVELDPNFPTARLYLATAYMSQYIPGADSPENAQMAKAAYDQFVEVLKQDPVNTVAMASIASLFFNQKKFEEAKEWYQKLIGVDPKNKEAYYTLGVIAWSKAFPVRMDARARLGMRPEDPGPLKDKKVREEVKEKNMPVVEEGLKSLEKALEIDPKYDDAMAYLNLLHRERGDLADNVEGFRKDTEIADNWVQKTLETKKIKQAQLESKAGGGIHQDDKK